MKRKTLQEIRGKTTKNMLWSLAESKKERERERGKFEKFLKKCFEQVKSDFFKPYSRVLIDRKPVLIN